MVIEWKLSVILFQIFSLPTTTTTLPVPAATTSVPSTRMSKTFSPFLSLSNLPPQQSPIQPSSTKTKLGHFLLPRQNSGRQPIDCGCSLPFHLFIECHVSKVEHCKTRPPNGPLSNTTDTANGISYDYSWPFSMKHLKYDPSGQLSLSVGLLELLRNSILQHELDSYLSTKESSLEKQPSRGEDIEGEKIKEPELESQQVKNPVLLNEPTGQRSLAFGGRPSQANYEEQPEDVIFASHLSRKEGDNVWESRRDPWPRDPHRIVGIAEPHQGIGLVKPHSKWRRRRIKSKLRLL